jgi:hypothetical protein
MQFCRDCHHVYQLEQPFADAFLVFEDCPFCGSIHTGLAADRLTQSRAAPSKTQEPQHDAARQAQYPYAYRLSRGFAILDGGEI